MSISHLDTVLQFYKMSPLGKAGGRVQGILYSISASSCESVIKIIIDILYYFKIKSFKNTFYFEIGYMAGLGGELRPQRKIQSIPGTPCTTFHLGCYELNCALPKIHRLKP